MANQIINAPTINVNITPFAFQFWAKDFYGAYKAYHTNTARFSPARFYLLSRSLELALKALHLEAGATVKRLRQLGHDLEKACDAQMLAGYQIQITPDEQSELSKANAYYKHKGFEYFLFRTPSLGVPEERSGPQLAATGYPNLPEESSLESLLQKLLEPKL